MENSELVCKLKNDDILYFDHIPKAAGTTFTSINDQHFDTESICPEQLWDKLLPTLPKDFSKYQLIRGHFGYGIHRLLPKKPKYITMLREPIARSISWYDFVCSNAEKNPSMKKFLFDKSLKLSEVLVHPNKKNSFVNNQTRFLSKDLPPSFFDSQIDEQRKLVSSMFLSPVDTSDLEIAKKRLAEFTFFGLTERFDDSMFLLCYTFCWRPIKRVVRKMIGNHKHTVKDTDKDIMQTLEKLTELDADLYHFAQELFEIRFKKMISELREKYHEPRFEEMPAHEMVFEMLEKHYEENFVTQSKNSIDFNFREKISGAGWYAREKDLDNIYFRWIGKEPAEIDFPLLEKNHYKLQFSVHKIADQKCLQGIKFKINDHLVTMNRISSGKIFEGIIQKSFLNHEKNFTRFTIELSHTIPKKTDGEHVGIAPNRIKISPYLPNK